MRESVLLRRRHLAGLPVAAVSMVLALATPGHVLATSTGPLSLVPDPADFGTIVVDTTRRIMVTAKNTLSTPLVVTSVRAPAAPFRIDSNACSGKTVAPGGICQVTVAFIPRTTGPFSATLQIETGDQVSTATLKGSAGLPTPTTTPGSTTTTSGASTTTSTRPPTTVSVVPTSVPSVTTTTVTATTIPVPPPPDDQRLRECERQARDAKVAYAPTRKMGIGETEQVQVTASVGDATATTSTPTTGGVTTTVVPVALRCEVQAQLRGEDFTVNPGAFQVASFLDRPVVTWSWDVVPLKAGTGVLTLEIRSIAEIDGRRIEGAGGELFTTSIDVGVKPEDFGQKLTRWSKNVVEHPLVKGFGSLVVIFGALAAGWRWLLKRPWPWTKRSPAATGRRRRPRR